MSRPHLDDDEDEGDIDAPYQDATVEVNEDAMFMMSMEKINKQQAFFSPNTRNLLHHTPPPYFVVNIRTGP